MSVNLVSLTGNITRDAELHKTVGNGTSVLNMSIAVADRRRNNQTGAWEEHANFIDLTIFGKRAEVVHPFCTKGTKIAVQGKLRQNTWIDKDGKKRSRITVIVDEIDFMSRRDKRYGDSYDEFDDDEVVERYGNESGTEEATGDGIALI